jgi:hypothetical protein
LNDIIQQIEDLINHGRYLEARAKTDDALRSNENLRLRQLHALSLSKSGAPEAARDYLEPFYKTNSSDPETAGILGSIYKELFKKNQQVALALQSRDTYLKNFEATGSYYTGINASAMSAMVMQASKSREIANRVIQSIQPDTTDFWELATLGEAYLLIKEKVRSTELYVKARKSAGTDWGKIISVYHQLWLLNHFIPVSAEVVKMFNPPAVVAFVGHMIDHPERKSPRFPADIEAKVKEGLANNIRTLNAKIGYCSLACGGDILFAEAMAEQGGEVNIFIPFAIPDFIEMSIKFAGEQWIQRFNALREKFQVTLITTDRYYGYDDLFSFQCKLIFGSAILRGATNHAKPTLITVLSDVDLRRSEGGTRDTLRLWPYPQRHINTNPDTFVLTERKADSGPSVSRTTTKEIDRPVLYLIAADLNSLNSIDRERLQKIIYEKIENETIEHVAHELNEDYILIAFEFETGAIEMLSIMLDAVKKANGKSDIKIAMHAGPVYRSGTLIKGDNVTILKEMSQFSPRATICASGEMAAVLALDPEKFNIEYGGIISSQDNESKHSVYNISTKK